MGGKIAATLALNYPKKVNSLAIMDISPISYSETELEAVTNTVKFLFESESKLKTAGSKDKMKYIIESFTTEEGLQAFLMSNLQPDSTGFSWKYHVLPLYEGISNILGFKEYTSSYNGPTVIIKAGTHFKIIIY